MTRFQPALCALDRKVWIIQRAIAGTRQMIESGEVAKEVPGYPRKLDKEELAALQEVLCVLNGAQQMLADTPRMQDDVPIGALFTSQEMVQVLSKKANIEWMMDLWEYDPKNLSGLFEYFRLLGGKSGKQQLHIYFFIQQL